MREFARLLLQGRGVRVTYRNLPRPGQCRITSLDSPTSKLAAAAPVQAESKPSPNKDGRREASVGAPCNSRDGACSGTEIVLVHHHLRRTPNAMSEETRLLAAPLLADSEHPPIQHNEQHFLARLQLHRHCNSTSPLLRLPLDGCQPCKLPQLLKHEQAEDRVRPEAEKAPGARSMSAIRAQEGE